MGKTTICSMMLPVILLGAGCACFKQCEPVPAGQYAQSFDDGAGATDDYLLYIPEEYNQSNAQWPLMLFLHGAGERGSNLELVKKHGPPKLAENGDMKLPFVIVSPQCPKDDKWNSETQTKVLELLLNDIITRYRIDRSRIYLTGLSMGGYGTWSLGARHPDWFAALAPICGSGDPATAQSISHLPIWVFHGKKDKAVPFARSEEMVAALKQAGSNVKFTIYPDAGHDSWTETYNNPELYDWFLAHRRTEKRK
ncbi:MAG: prolyl oligopeptidase family serine peptidase [Kiritimatiellales bacterium]|nr:prolyl oligopeptidase family serine peptidase [Kiritimatiellales bacterium]